MKSNKKLLALLLALCLMVSLLAGCGGDAQKPADGEATGEETGEETGEGFNIAVNLASEPQTIDPALNSAVDGAVMLQHMFEGLIKWVDSGDGRAKNEMGQAESYTVEKKTSEDGTEYPVYTFVLRDGLKWSDGQPLTAEDFVYTWQRAVAPETAADYNYMLDMVLNANEIMAGEKDPSELGIKAIDEKTLEITLTYDCPYFLEVCAFPTTFPVRKDIIEQYGDQWTFENYVSNGPYKLTEWEHQSYILVEKNENYYDYENLGPDSIKFVLMDDQNAVLAAYRGDQLDFIDEVPVDETAALLESGELVVADYIGTYYVCFQNQKAPFDNPKVREAFSLAIDRNYIVKEITQTGEVPAAGYVPAGVYDAAGPAGDDFRTNGGNYYDPSEEAYAANCERAKQLLAEAGYPNGEGFPTVEYLYNTSDSHKAIGEALQYMWQEVLGVNVSLQNEEWNTFLQTRKDGNYSIARNGWIADYNDPISFLDMWMTGGGNNDAQYSNPDYDAKIALAKSSADPEVRMTAMHEAEDIIMGEFAICPLYFYTNQWMIKDRVQGMYYTPLGYQFFMYCTEAK